jgi:SAM-dependent methyltransferase
MKQPDDTCELSIGNLAALFGATVEEVQAFCGPLLGSLDLRYRPIIGSARDALILQILQRIDAADLQASGEDRRPDWEMGWEENLQEFVDSGYDVEKLVPKYFKKNVPVRLFGDYVQPTDPNFVLNCTRLFRTWLFKKYLSGMEVIYEFGCGPATHLAYLAELYPEKELVGLDWAAPSQEIIRLLAQHRKWSITGLNFDFFHPDETVSIKRNSAIFTFGALEQVGRRHEAFLDFILRREPALCINIECLVELYDEKSLPGYLALKYHRQKNYLNGYLTRLRTIEARKQAEILSVHHQPFGNIFDDSHSYIVWRPIK